MKASYWGLVLLTGALSAFIGWQSSLRFMPIVAISLGSAVFPLVLWRLRRVENWANAVPGVLFAWVAATVVHQTAHNAPAQVYYEAQPTVTRELPSNNG
jgi:hypothetical protein